MPQLVKGGKYIFGWTKINNNLEVRVPDETYDEYKLSETGKVILMSASKTSGGFNIFKPESLVKSQLGQLTNHLGYSSDTNTFSARYQAIIYRNTRLICWTTLDENNYVHLSDDICSELLLKTGDKLLVARGSGLGPSFLIKGPIYDEALRHKNIPEFR